MENSKNKDKELKDKLNNFLDIEENQECEGDECYIKKNDDIVEKVNKKLITDDGRQLLM